MNTILVLTDFSDVSLHAAKYACSISRQLNSKRIVLYHSYELITPSSAAAITGQLNFNVLEDNYNLADNQLLREDSLRRLEQETNLMREWVDSDVVIEYTTENIHLADGINDIAGEYEAYLLVMGISEKEGLDTVLGGSNAVEVADVSKYPVMIVPGESAIGPVDRIVFAYDQGKAKNRFPENELRKLLDDFKAALMVVHVDKERSRIATEAEGPAGMPEMYRLLQAYQPSFDFIENDDTVAGITEYAAQHKASLILAIGKNHGFFKGLFHRSVTHKLAYHSPIPLLFIHEKQ